MQPLTTEGVIPPDVDWRPNLLTAGNIPLYVATVNCLVIWLCCYIFDTFIKECLRWNIFVTTSKWSLLWDQYTASCLCLFLLVFVRIKTLQGTACLTHHFVWWWNPGLGKVFHRRSLNTAWQKKIICTVSIVVTAETFDCIFKSGWDLDFGHGNSIVCQFQSKVCFHNNINTALIYLYKSFI